MLNPLPFHYRDGLGMGRESVLSRGAVTGSLGLLPPIGLCVRRQFAHRLEYPEQPLEWDAKQRYFQSHVELGSNEILFREFLRRFFFQQILPEVGIEPVTLRITTHRTSRCAKSTPFIIIIIIIQGILFMKSHARKTTSDIDIYKSPCDGIKGEKSVRVSMRSA